MSVLLGAESMDDVMGESSRSPRGQAAASCITDVTASTQPQLCPSALPDAFLTIPKKTITITNFEITYTYDTTGRVQAMGVDSLTRLQHQHYHPQQALLNCNTPSAADKLNCFNTCRFWAVLPPPCCCATAHGLLPGTANTQRLVARQSVLWPQHFTFLSAVSADNSVTCSHVMTDRAKLAGSPLYTVLGDQTGRLYFFTPQGHLLHEYDTGTTSDSAFAS